MEDEGKQQTKRDSWPQVKFMFSVKFGDTEAFFEEVTGMSAETQQMELRSGNRKTFFNSDNAGDKKYGSITLKRGIFKEDKALWEMYRKVKANSLERQTIIISLLDEKNSAAMSWTLTNAFPTKITAPGLNADANDVAVETIEIAHEGLALVK